MAEAVIIYGKSGSGKSRSLLNFGEDEILLVNTIGKRMPFQKKFKYVLNSDDIGVMLGKMQKMPCKVAVIDDAGYIMTNAFMRGHSAPKSGSSSYDLYNMIADGFFQLLNFIKTKLPEDVIVYIMLHEESNDFGEVRLRTIGKLLDQKVCIEGMATIVLRCVSKDGKHLFLTNTTDGSEISKSPESMFDLEIENDLKAVDTRIREYWGIGGENNAV